MQLVWRRRRLNGLQYLKQSAQVVSLDLIILIFKLIRIFIIIFILIFEWIAEFKAECLSCTPAPWILSPYIYLWYIFLFGKSENLYFSFWIQWCFFSWMPPWIVLNIKFIFPLYFSNFIFFTLIYISKSVLLYLKKMLYR